MPFGVFVALDDFLLGDLDKLITVMHAGGIDANSKTLRGVRIWSRDGPP